MNTTDLLAKWSNLSLEQIEASLASGPDARAARRLYGTKTLRQMQAPARRPGRPVAAAAAAGARKAVVLLPGIMGSLLNSIRGITTSLWINPVLFLEGNAGYLEMNPDGTADAVPAIEAAPVGIEKLVYLKMALALRRECDLFEFPYDWRRPIEHNAELLHACLERWSGDSGRRFTLVGHSMGGLVARAYLASHPADAERRVERVISLGTPYFGATNAIENVVLGNSMMELAEKLNARNQTRGLLMNMPSFYQLLPAPPELFPAGRDYPANWDLYRATEWRWQGIRQKHLDGGRAFHDRLRTARAQVPTVQIAGCNIETTVEIRRTFDQDDRPAFEPIRRDRGLDAGDGTVPLWSARLPSATLYYVQERHRYLPTNDEVIEAVLELIHGGKPDLPTDIPPRRGGFFAPRAVRTPAELDAEAAELRRRLQEGTATEEDLAKLYFAM